MTKQISETFYNYITNNSSDNITLFRNIYQDKIYDLPDKIVSSKYLINYLKIQDTYKFKIFKDVFSDYFKYKLNK